MSNQRIRRRITRGSTILRKPKQLSAHHRLYGAGKLPVEIYYIMCVCLYIKVIHVICDESETRDCCRNVVCKHITMML